MRSHENDNYFASHHYFYRVPIGVRYAVPHRILQKRFIWCAQPEYRINFLQQLLPLRYGRITARIRRKAVGMGIMLIIVISLLNNLTLQSCREFYEVLYLACNYRNLQEMAWRYKMNIIFEVKVSNNRSIHSLDGSFAFEISSQSWP